MPTCRDTFRWIPSTVTFAPYKDIWSTIPLATYFKNSLIVSVTATLLSVAIAVFAAYAVSRYTFRGRRVFTTAVLSTRMFPGILLLLPLFLIFVRIQTTIRSPRELEQAAFVDGCGPLRALFRVVIPTAMPGIVAVAVFAFITSWGEVLFASMLTSERTRTLAIGLQAYASQSNVYWNQLMAASVVVSIPVLVGFLSVQRYLIRGLTAGAVK